MDGLDQNLFSLLISLNNRHKNIWETEGKSLWTKEKTCNHCEIYRVFFFIMTTFHTWIIDKTVEDNLMRFLMHVENYICNIFYGH